MAKDQRNSGRALGLGLGVWGVPIGSIVVPFCGSYLESYKVIPKRNYYDLGWSSNIGFWFSVSGGALEGLGFRV